MPALPASDWSVVRIYRRVAADEDDEREREERDAIEEEEEDEEDDEEEVCQRHPDWTLRPPRSPRSETPFIQIRS
eukprot:290635-Pyramimonas_sp.AAC.1